MDKDSPVHQVLSFYTLQSPYVHKWNLLKIGTVFRNEWDSKLLRGGTL